MKKFLALATLLVVLLALPLTAGAERSGWKSNTFPFKNVKSFISKISAGRIRTSEKPIPPLSEMTMQSARPC